MRCFKPGQLLFLGARMLYEVYRLWSKGCHCGRLTGDDLAYMRPMIENPAVATRWIYRKAGSQRRSQLLRAPFSSLFEEEIA